jgi:ABC-2 type transport system ATP-binding protein
MIKINNLYFSYKKNPALNNLSLRVENNHYFALAGLNGAGKTTLIRLIVDLIRSPNRSDILINDISSWRVESRKNLIYLPEKFKLNSNITAMDYFNLISGVYQQDLDRNKVESLCEALSFPSQFLHQKSSSYSKGMLQKIGLIGCLVQEIPFLLLDEPLSGLDPKARRQVKQILLDEKVVSGRTLFYSTHMLSDVDEFCDSFGILHNGALKFIGTPQQCKEQYNSSTLEQAYMACIDEV